MRLQISLEMQLYLALAGLGLLYAVAELSSIAPGLEGKVYAYRTIEFVDLLNTNIFSGNSSFVAYLPIGSCNATINGDYIDTAYGNFPMQARLDILDSAFCPDNQVARIYLAYNTTSDYVEVSR